jgi:hypothetical protein
MIRKLSDIAVEAAKLHREKVKTPTWGEWILNKDTMALVHAPTDYYVDLEEITSSAQILDWIFQIRQKQWANPKVMADLLEAFKTILDPQANYCSMGKDRRSNGSDNVRRFLSGV